MSPAGLARIALGVGVVKYGLRYEKMVHDTIGANTKKVPFFLISVSIYFQFRDLLDDLAVLSSENIDTLKSVIKTFPSKERKKRE